MNKFLSFLLVCGVFLSNSIKADVYHKETPHHNSRVQITTTEREDDGEIFVKFEYCEGTGQSQSCKTLGTREFYSLEELNKRKVWEFLDYFRALEGPLVLMGAYTTSALLGSWLPVAVAGGLVLVFTVWCNLNDLSCGRTLSDPVLKDEDIELERMIDVSDFADRLTTVLNNIDGVVEQ